MTNVTILRGYSGSGKSRYATGLAIDGAVVVSRDAIRSMMLADQAKRVLDQAGENLVTKIEEAAVRGALRQGKDVVVDDTNLRAKFARRWADIAVQEGATFMVHSIKTPVETCIVHDSWRAFGVGEQVIRDQARKFPMDQWPEIRSSAKATFTPYVADTSLPEAYGFDLDGTLAQMNGRGPYESHLYSTDVVDPAVRDVLVSLYVDGYKIVIMTGRSEEHRTVVESWLTQKMIPFTELIMRKKGDTRNDGIVKAELFDEFVSPKYNFKAQFDDRDRVVQALRAKGIKVFQVQEGAF